MNIVFGMIFLILCIIWFYVTYQDSKKRNKVKFIVDIITACAYLLLALFYIFAIRF